VLHEGLNDVPGLVPADGLMRLQLSLCGDSKEDSGEVGPIIFMWLK
jgi:hypothetical protein